MSPSSIEKASAKGCSVEMCLRVLDLYLLACVSVYDVRGYWYWLMHVQPSVSVRYHRLLGYAFVQFCDNSHAVESVGHAIIDIIAEDEKFRCVVRSLVRWLWSVEVC